jgi:drug/metabolite transporter (DMT)-like permease
MGLLCLIWGSTWLVIREGLRDLPPFTSAGVRFAVAAAVMVLVAPRLAQREGGHAPPFSLTLAMGVCNFSVPYGIVYWSEQFLPSGLVSVLWSVFPMLMAVSGHLWLPGERLCPRQWVGFVFGLVGIALLFATDLAQIGAEAIPVGLILLISPAISAVGTTLVKRHGEHVSSVLLNRNGMLLGAVLLLATAQLSEADRAVRWSPAAIGSVLYLAIAGTVVTFGLYFWLMRFAPAYLVSLIAYVIPAIALALGAFLGNEVVGWHTMLGAACILCGVGWVVFGKR